MIAQTVATNDVMLVLLLNTGRRWRLVSHDELTSCVGGNLMCVSVWVWASLPVCVLPAECTPDCQRCTADLQTGVGSVCLWCRETRTWLLGDHCTPHCPRGHYGWHGACMSKELLLPSYRTQRSEVRGQGSGRRSPGGKSVGIIESIFYSVSWVRVSWNCWCPIRVQVLGELVYWRDSSLSLYGPRLENNLRQQLSDTLGF